MGKKGINKSHVRALLDERQFRTIDGVLFKNHKFGS